MCEANQESGNCPKTLRNRIASVALYCGMQKFNPKLFPIDYRSPIEAEGFQTYVYWISAKGTEYHLPHHRIQKGLKFRAL